MKKSLSFVLAAALFLSTNAANALLIEVQDADSHVVLDTVTTRSWLWDLSALIEQTYQQQVATIEANYAGQQYGGISTWHMANFEEMTYLWRYPRESLQVFNPTFYGELDTYWGGRYENPFNYELEPYHSTAFVLEDSKLELRGFGGAADWVADEAMGAWVVSDPSSGSFVAPVPEPTTTLLLLVSGAFALGFIRKIRRA